MGPSHFELFGNTGGQVKNIGLTRPFPSGSGVANSHYPTLRARISTAKLKKAPAKIISVSGILIAQAFSIFA